MGQVDRSADELRILHFVLSVAPEWDSIAWSTLNLARSQSLIGHRSTIWCINVDGAADPTGRLTVEALGGCEVRMFAPTPPARLGFSRAMAVAARSSDGQSYDVLHQHGLWRAFSHATNGWRSAHGKPTVLAPAGTLSPEALRFSRSRKWLASLAYEERNLRQTSCLHAKSALEALGFRRYGLVNPIAVIPSGVPDAWLTEHGDASRFRHRYALGNEKRVMLCLARVHPIKGLPLLIAALASSKVAFGDWVVIVAGRSELGHRGELEAQVREAGLQEMVRFIGHIGAEDRRDALAAADLFVLPTLSESFGIAVAEALGAGVPALTTHGAPWEELESERCGWHVYPTIGGIGEGLREAVSRPQQELRAMGARGRELVARKYTWSRIAAMTVELYGWLLRRRAQPSFVGSSGTRR